MFKNKKYNLMNPENPNSPFFKDNVLKQGTISSYSYNNDDINANDSDYTPAFSSNSMSSINNIDDDYGDYNSTLSTSSCFQDVSNSSSSYDYNEEFNYNYSYNGYEKDTCGYDAHNNDIYDNFDGGLYDLYENNTFKDY